MTPTNNNGQGHGSMSPQPPWARDDWHPTPAAPPPADTTMLAGLQRLWQQGGWDASVLPAVAWRMRLGDAVPIPTEADWPTLPTLGPVDAYLDDPRVSLVLLNGPGRETLLRHSEALDLGTGQTWHPAWLDWLVRQLRARGQGWHTEVHLRGTIDLTRPGWQTPLLVRYEGVLPPLCAHGPALTLQIVRPGQWSLDGLVQGQTLTPVVAETLAGAMRAGVGLLITGLAGTGKTTLAQALLTAVPDQRCYGIQDRAELVVSGDRAVMLATLPTPQTQVADLIASAVRSVPDRIVLGCLSGTATYALLGAARSGAPILTTVTAASVRQALSTVAALALEDPTAQGLPDLVHQALKVRPLVLVALERQQGRRQVAEVAEVLVERGSGFPRVQTWYDRDPRTGDLVTAGVPGSTGRPMVSDAMHAQLLAAGAIPEEWLL